MKPGGFRKVSLKNVSEIALIKSKDPAFENVLLQQVCKSVIIAAHSCVIEVVPYLEDTVLRRKEKYCSMARKKQLEEIRQGKMLRL